MRDDHLGLAALKSQFVPKPLASPAPRSASARAIPVPFLSQLARATTARNGSLPASNSAPTRYKSPLAGSNKPSLTQSPSARATTSTAGPGSKSTVQPPTTPKARSTTSLARPPHARSTPARTPAASAPTAPAYPADSLHAPPLWHSSPSSTHDSASAQTSLTPVGPSITGGGGRSTPGTAPANNAPKSATKSAPTDLADYPRPVRDNGRGLHWIPTTRQSPEVIDRFVAEAQRMGVTWVTFLNDGPRTGDNDYLVRKLSAAGIEPVMRIYSPTMQPLQGDIEGMVRHYAAMGVHYFQPFNEPNLNCENPDGKVSVERYLEAWLPAARAIERGGGLPGFGSLAPGGDYDDQEFLKASLDGLKARGELGALDKAWISMHNYTWNHPIADRGNGDGFFKFRAYQATVRAVLGHDLPIVGTEGGTFEGQQEDPKMSAVTAAMAAEWTRQAFTYMRDEREPWLFASSVWTVANGAGGASDSRFEAQALFKANGSQNAIVAALRTLG